MKPIKYKYKFKYQSPFDYDDQKENPMNLNFLNEP